MRPSISTAALVLLAGSAASCGHETPRAPHTVAAPALKITTTLEGRNAIPQRFRWLAHPSVPEAKIDAVDFLIDGKLRGVERHAPYNYGSDDLHGHLGWLVTSWLTPGQHRFTARARLRDGRTASDTAVVRVGKAPAPPTRIGRTHWQREVTAGAIAKAGGDIPPGRWQLVFDRTGVWELDPAGSGVVEHAVVRGDRVAIDAAVWMVPYDNGHGKVNRYGHKDIGFGFREDGPPAVYRWSVSGDTLRLTALQESSGSRRAMWNGTWTRAH
jgi:hypothetical protein